MPARTLTLLATKTFRSVAVETCRVTTLNWVIGHICGNSTSVNYGSSWQTSALFLFAPSMPAFRVLATNSQSHAMHSHLIQAPADPFLLPRGIEMTLPSPFRLPCPTKQMKARRVNDGVVIEVSAEGTPRRFSTHKPYTPNLLSRQES